MSADTPCIQYVSDIHLEMYTDPAPPFEMFVCPGSAKYLILAGDIGTPELRVTETRTILSQFLEWCSQRWTAVFWIPGNHEFYNFIRSNKKSREEKLADLQKCIEPFPNVFLLYRRTFDIKDTPIRILGCTLWSHIPPQDEENTLSYMNDMLCIFVNGVTAMPCHFNAWHAEDVEWLSNEIQIAKQEHKRVIVVTHHLPSFQLIHPKYQHFSLNTCYATNLESSLIVSPVYTWICGHTHTSNDVKINDVWCVSNPYGYPKEHIGGCISKTIPALKTEVPENQEGEENVVGTEKLSMGTATVESSPRRG